MIEKVPEIMAWLAIMAAKTATTNIGRYKGSKNEYDTLDHLGCHQNVGLAVNSFTWDGLEECIRNKMVVAPEERSLSPCTLILKLDTLQSTCLFESTEQLSDQHRQIKLQFLHSMQMKIFVKRKEGG